MIKKILLIYHFDKSFKEILSILILSMRFQCETFQNIFLIFLFEILIKTLSKRIFRFSLKNQKAKLNDFTFIKLK